MLPSGAASKWKNSANILVQDSRRRIGALWRRILAFLIDSIAIAAIGAFLGYFFFDLLMGLGPAGRLVGYFVGFVYFALPESSFGNGQSVGKRFLRLKIVNRDGNLISIERSFLRYTIFALPWFIYGLPFSISRMNPTGTFLFSLAIVGLGGATIYLIVFNRHTRQGVHDLATGSYVAEARMDNAISARPIWKPHWYIALIILVLAAVTGSETLSPRYGTSQLLADAHQVESLPGVQSASIKREIIYNGGKEEINLSSYVRCTITTSEEETLANQVANSLITTDPTIDKYSMLRIVLIRGYDIGIFHSSFSQTYSETPVHWRERFFAIPPQEPAP
ncbi:MAG TPA: RDD family protein [Terracidiphilus sp.]|nr:RDD family protein [Terracidiphilus sp.]